MPLAEALARAAVPLASLAAMAALAAHEVDPMAAAESGYLAVVAAAVLAAAAFLAPAPAIEAGLGAVLAAAVVWALPASPARGAALVLLLAATLAVAAGRRLATCRRELRGELPIAVSVPLAIGLQALLRGDLLLAPQGAARALVLVVLVPLAGALAVSFLSRRHGLGAAVAAGLAVAVTPGWTIATVLALAALAGGDALAASAGGTWRAAWPLRAAAIAAIAAPLAWGRAGWLAVAAGLALASPALGLGGAAALTAASLTWNNVWAHGSPIFYTRFERAFGRIEPGVWHDGATAAGIWIAFVFLCVPAAALPAAGRRRWALAGGLLAFAAPAFVRAGMPAFAALAAPLALLALAVSGAGTGAGAEATPEGAAPPAAVFQRAWTAALVAGTALLAAYPWLRAQPLADFLALVGPAPIAALAAAAAVALASLLSTAGRRPRPLLPAAAAAAVVFVGILVHQRPATSLLPDGEALRLAAGSPLWEIHLQAAPGAAPARGVALVSTLENGGGVAAGTAVATLLLDDGRGAGRRFTLVAGDDTAEWAARRPDVARALAAAGETTPPAWMSTVADGFFAQRYRRRFELPAAAAIGKLRLELAPGLPPKLALAVYRLEILR